MKKCTKIFAIMLAFLLLMPFTMVHADSPKAEEIVGMLNDSDTLKNINGTASNDDGMIGIDYSVANSSFSEMYFPYEGTVVDYTPDEITGYDEAVYASSCVMYAVKLIYSALELNGYTEEEISAYFRSEESDPTFEVNGFELKAVGEAQQFSSEDGYSSTTVTPLAVKVDVSRANLNTPEDEAKEPTDTTVQNVVDNLAADEDFTATRWDDGTLVSENIISCDDENVLIEHTDYTYEYHNVSFSCEDDVFYYEVGEIVDYDEATSVAEQEMWALVILQYALKANGYTQEEIAAFIGSEDSEFDYENNGLEITELGEAMEFEGDMGSITISPLSIKIDLARVNIEPAVKDTEGLTDDTEESEFVSDNNEETVITAESTEETAISADNTEETVITTDNSEESVITTDNLDESEGITQPAAGGSPQTCDTAIAVIVLLVISAAGIIVALKKAKRFN